MPHPNVVLFDVRVGFHRRVKLGISPTLPPRRVPNPNIALFDVKVGSHRRWLFVEFNGNNIGDRRLSR